VVILARPRARSRDVRIFVSRGTSDQI